MRRSGARNRRAQQQCRGTELDPPGQARLEAVVTLASMAAVTTRVRLAIGMIVLPQRQPVLLAKQLSTIDTLSKGRLIVGVGVGYVEPELRALGASLGDRSARTDEYLAAMRALWAEPVPSFAGQFVSFADVLQRPRPVQQPHPPLVIGGHSPAGFDAPSRPATAGTASTLTSRKPRRRWLVCAPPPRATSGPPNWDRSRSRSRPPATASVSTPRGGMPTSGSIG
jgi:hypothetical protein